MTADITRMIIFASLNQVHMMLDILNSREVFISPRGIISHQFLKYFELTDRSCVVPIGLMKLYNYCSVPFLVHLVF